MNRCFKTTVATAALLMAAGAWAGGIGNTYNNPSAGAAAGAVGVGVGVGVGQGGAGGQGGVGYGGAGGQGGVGIGQGGSASSFSGGNALQTSSSLSSTMTGHTINVPRNTATAYAPSLAASNGTCLGSASGGAQGPGFGVSFGTTMLDTGCDARYDAAFLRSMGLEQVAVARLCQKAEIAQAMRDGGTPCPVPPSAGKEEVASGVKYTDPFVRARMGLPPLD